MGGPGRLGVLGGSFDPPHIGHLIIASAAAHQLDLDRVLFVPAWSPPHKTVVTVPAPTRLLLTQAAVEEDEAFAACDIELQRHSRYTVDTLSYLREEWPASELSFIVGSDSLLALSTWRDPVGVLSQCRLAVALRPGDDPAVVAKTVADLGPGRATLLDTPLIGISSTDVRARLADGRPVRYMIPAAVERLIEELGLYASGDG